MTRVLIGGFLVAHGLVHIGVWATPKGDRPQPFDPSRSWLLDMLGVPHGAAHATSVAIAVLVGLGFVVAGTGLLVGASVWRTAAIASAIAAGPLFILYFNPWLTVGAALQAAIVYLLVVSGWPTEKIVGA